MPMPKGHRKYPYDYAVFGRCLKKCRLALQWPLREAARRAELHGGTLKHVEDGEIPLEPERRKLLVRTFKAALEKEALQAETKISRRRYLLLLSERLGAVAGVALVVDAPPTDPRKIRLGNDEDAQCPPDDWRRWWQEGIDESDRGNHSEALRSFKVMERLGADVPGVAALAYAHQLQEELDLGEDPWAKCSRYPDKDPVALGLERFGLVGLPRPTYSPDAEKLRHLLRDDVSLRAYGQLAKACGRWFQERRKFESARAAFQTYETVGNILEDEASTAEAKHHRGFLLTLTEMAPADFNSPAWNIVKNPAGFDWAVQLLREAYEKRRAVSGAGCAYDLRCLIKALHMLELHEGNRRTKTQHAAQRKEFAQELAKWIKAHPDSGGVKALVRLEDGRQAWERGDRDGAIDALDETLELGWNIQSPYVLVDAHGRLAEIFASSPGDRLVAIDHLAATIIAWPKDVYHQDYKRLTRRLGSLSPSIQEIEQAWRRSGSPTARLRAMSSFDESRAPTVLAGL